MTRPSTIPFSSVGAVDFKTRTFEAICTTPTVDRDREFAPLTAFRKQFPDYVKKNGVLLLGHQHKTTLESLPIGKCINYEFTDDGLKCKFYVTRRPIGDDLLILIDEGILKGLSLGFIPLDFIPNPSDHQLPSELRGKGIKKFYKECETVEISLLSIPSNRDALVIHAEKGNRVASMITKGWRGEDVTPVFKAWLAEEDPEEELKATFKSFVGKAFGWDESEHPRNEDGLFINKPGSEVLGGTNLSNGRNWADASRDEKRYIELNKKLDTVIAQQQKSQTSLNDVQDQYSWSKWAKSWVMRVGALAGLYYGVKHVLNSPAAKAKIADWIYSTLKPKGAVIDDQVDKMLHILDVTKAALEKAKTIGADKSPEYVKLQKFYDRCVDGLKIVAKSSNNSQGKGLSQLWVTKEMTAETFVESEHPRAVDGKFRNKSEGAGVKKAKATHVDEDTRIKEAMDHPDVPGAGAAKRVLMDLSPNETFKTVMAEFKNGTLRSGNGNLVKSPARAKAIAISEAKKSEKRTKIQTEEGSEYYQAKTEQDAKKQEKEAADKRQDQINLLISLALFGIWGYASFRRHQTRQEAFWKAQQEYRRQWQSEFNRRRTSGDYDWQRRWEETFNRFRQEHQGGSGGTRSYSNFDTGPEIMGESKLWKRMKPLRDTAKLTIDQIEKGTYKDKPVPKDVLNLHVALTHFNNKLKTEGSELRGVKEVVADTEKTLEKLGRLIKENWAKHGVKEDFAAKDFSDIVVKEMSSAEFKEEEHPRAPAGNEHGGEFVSKNEPNPESGAWGGTRKNAGRTPKDPVAAHARLVERFKAENPNITDDVLKQKIADFATEKGNIDLHMYVTDPVAYQKRRDQELMDIANSRRGKTFVNRRTVDRADDSEATKAIRSSILTSRADWQREVVKANDIYEAYQTFQDKNADKVAVDKARLTTAAATIATIVGLGVLYYKRPTLAKAGFESLRGAETGSVASTTSHLAREPMTFLRWFDEVANTAKMQEAQRQGRLNTIEARQIGAIKRFVIDNLNKGEGLSEKNVKLFKKIFGDDAIVRVPFPKKGGPKYRIRYPMAGPWKYGYGPESIYKISNYKVIDPSKGNFSLQKGDFDKKTGLSFYKLGPDNVPTDKVDYIQVAIANKRIPSTPARIKDSASIPDGLAKDGSVWKFAGPDEKGITGEERFKEFLKNPYKDKKGKEHKSIITVENGEERITVPGEVVRPRNPKHIKEFYDAAAKFKTGGNFFTRNVLPGLSLRALGMLTATAGASGEGAYYFQADIEKWLNQYLKGREEQQQSAAKTSGPSTDAVKRSTALQEAKVQLAIKKQEERNIRATKQRDETKISLLRDRERVRDELTKAGIRKYVEGTVFEWAAEPNTFMNRLHKLGYLNNPDKMIDILTIMRTREKNKILPFIQQVHEELEQKYSEKPKQEPPLSGENFTDSDKKAKFEQTASDFNEHFDRKKETKELSGLDLIIKMFEPNKINEEPNDGREFDDLLTNMAAELAKMISDISQSCKLAVQSGMPGSSGFAELNDIINEIYGYLKDVAKKNTPEVAEKGFENPVMSTQVDIHGGLFANPRRCRVCGRKISEELLLKCNEANCPMSYLEKIESKN